MVAVLVTVMMGAAQIGAAVLARHRAQAAADLAALAAAAQVPAGSAAACARADRLVRQMRAAVAACTVDGLDVVVTVQLWPALRNRWLGPARAAARAGPSSATDHALPALADLLLRE